MLRAGLSGLGLTIVFHEVEVGVKSLCDLIEEGEKMKLIRSRAQELARLLGGFAVLVRKGKQRTNSLQKLLRRACEINHVRFRHHEIRLDCPTLEDDEAEATAGFVFGSALGALNNLLDNAIYWLGVRWPDDGSRGRHGRSTCASITILPKDLQL